MKINGNGNTVKHNSKKKVVTVIIAAAVVSAMGISAYAAFKGGLEGVAFGQPTGTTESTDAEMTRYPELDPAKNQMISLQGYSDTDEYKASKEWREFEDNYDKDWSICDAYDKECKRTKKDPFEEKYPGYGIYSQEMADKADELIKKYNLKLRGKMLDMDINEKVLQEKFGDIWTGIVGVGYCYEDGTFSLDADYEKVSFQIRRVMKGSFDTVYLNVGEISSYEQWTYKTKCGVEVSIALNDRGGVVLANTPKGFVAINLCENEDEFGKPIKYTKAMIEEFVDHINFDKL